MSDEQEQRKTFEACERKRHTVAPSHLFDRHSDSGEYVDFAIGLAWYHWQACAAAAAERIAELEREVEGLSTSVSAKQHLIAALESALAAVTKERDALQGERDRATAILGDDEVMQYVTSGNAIPVTRCTVSADLIRQLVEGRRNAEAHPPEALTLLIQAQAMLRTMHPSAFPEFHADIDAAIRAVQEPKP